MMNQLFFTFSLMSLRRLRMTSLSTSDGEEGEVFNVEASPPRLSHPAIVEEESCM